MEYIKPPVNVTWDSMEKNVTVSKYNNDKTPRTKQFRIGIIKKTGCWRSFLDYISPPLALYCIKIRENVQIVNHQFLGIVTLSKHSTYQCMVNKKVAQLEFKKTTTKNPHYVWYYLN